ncbi:hypothetical protein, partial [Mycobacterium asiaticum]
MRPPRWRQLCGPTTGVSAPTGLVVKSTGTVYVSDGGNNRVLMLPTDT